VTELDERSEQELYAHGLRYSAYDTASSLVLGLASAIITARVFGAEVIGAFALAALLTGSLHLVSNLREQGGLVRELTRHARSAPEPPALLWVTLALSAAITLVVLVPFAALSVWLLTDVFDRPELVLPFAVLAAGYLLLDNTSFNLDAPLVAYRDGRSLWFARMAMSVAMIAGALICAALGEERIGGLVACTVASSVAGLGVRTAAVRQLTGLRTGRRELAWARGQLRQIISFGVRAAPLNFTEAAIGYADTAILGANATLTTIGAYNRAYGLYQRAASLPVSLSRLYFPTMSALHHRGDRAAMARVHRLSTRYLALVLAPAATWLAASAPAVLAIFGPGFDAAATALAILAAVVVLDCWSRPAGGVLWAADRPGVVSLVYGGVAALNVGLCLLLIPTHGLTGAALANLGGWLISAAVLPLLAAGELERGRLAMFDAPFALRLAGVCAVLAVALIPLRALDGALLWQLLALAPALALGLLLFRPLERADGAFVERALIAAGMTRPRLLRAVGVVHALAAH
jgi:O-antigen/teichoic acid export membrane protein